MTDFTKLKKLFNSKQENDFKTELVNFDRRKLKRKEIVEFAAMARRSGCSDMGIKILNPIIRSEKILEVAQVDELVEYSSCLYRVGLIGECQKILNGIKKETSQKILYQAFCKFAQWKYQESIPILKHYLDLKNLQERELFIGKLNLSSAYIYIEEFSQAEELLSECERFARNKKFDNYLGNINELRSQIFFYQGQYRQAKQYLNKAQEHFQNESSFGQLFVHKWLSLINFKKDKSLLKKVK